MLKEDDTLESVRVESFVTAPNSGDGAEGEMVSESEKAMAQSKEALSARLSFYTAAAAKKRKMAGDKVKLTDRMGREAPKSIKDVGMSVIIAKRMATVTSKDKTADSEEGALKPVIEIADPATVLEKRRHFFVISSKGPGDDKDKAKSEAAAKACTRANPQTRPRTCIRTCTLHMHMHMHMHIAHAHEYAQPRRYRRVTTLSTH